ncbi:pyruvate ferredoxin oxidoreductase [bacterium]|uniref:Pyruvate ferredoxin oxidoreductase n=1 Tax=candidate division WOR-3 bacterium TaxID=2052148 RepID=A0A7C0ZED4_UNCW3|nr:MAG: pyruvate ferredoxin oxidoreductase [bacterium]RKZ20331.1 MAG: pyruvate ferredoxin oxidoreductase [bacterium]HDI82582.1 pyruvate ferredoxin oxidoreductase [candidate division WOR-3 bacterium]
MLEIRFHGRGGQGTVVASKMLAVGVAKEGKYVQAFPEFGVERRGAPVVAFIRIDEGPIYIKSKIYQPDHIVILDPTLIGAVDVTEGLKPGAWIIVNSEKEPDKFDFGKDFKVATIDATSIAIKYRLGSKTSPIVNTAILGAVIRVLNPCSLESLIDGIKEEAPVKPEENAQAAKEAYERVKGGDL